MPVALAEIVQGGGSVNVGSELAFWQAKELVELGQARVTVRGAGFAYWQVTEIGEAGGGVELTSEFAFWQVKEIAEDIGSRLTVQAEGFATWQLDELSDLGARISGRGPAAPQRAKFAALHGKV